MADEAGSYSERKAGGGYGGEEEVKVGAVELSVGRKAEDTIRRGVKKEGYLQKRGYRFYNLCACCVGPVWKDRYFVLSGGYLFRFTNESHTTPKGRPVNLLDVEIREAPVSEGLCCIQLSSVRKTHIIRCPTEDVRTQWLRALRASKRHAIEVGLGHANESATDFAARSLGSKIIREKDRHQAQSEKMQAQLLQDAAFSAKASW